MQSTEVNGTQDPYFAEIDMDLSELSVPSDCCNGSARAPGDWCVGCPYDGDCQAQVGM